MDAPSARALARALHDAEALVTHVPGFGGTEVFAAYADLSRTLPRVSWHEEVAHAIAHGAALTGRRAAVLLKAHGLAKAANSVIDSLTCGTTAGFVTLVFNDVTGSHSDSILDAPSLLAGLGVPYRVAAPGRLYTSVRDCFLWSEAMGLPVGLVVDAEHQEEPETGRSAHWPPPPVYRPDPLRHVLCPPLAAYQHAVERARREGKSPHAVPRPTPPRIPDGLPPSLRSRVARYIPAFEMLASVRSSLVMGDAGLSSLFAFPPCSIIDVTTYMGGSIPLATGALLAGHGGVWAVSGDFSFIAAGHLGLLEAVGRGLPLKVLVFQNGRAEATGGQYVDAQALDAVLAGFAPYVIRARGNSEIALAIREAAAEQALRVVVADVREGG